MREISLLRLTVRNFKGCDALTLDFGGRSASIYGDNAAGKTTVYDALTWLLFGKDSRGQSGFEIKPLTAAGEVRDHGAVTEVEALLDVDGQEIALRKTYFEKWSTKRGSAESSYDGNTCEYFVDGVPTKKYEYERRTGELVSEEQFRMLTGVTWFCEGMKWQDRRKVLFEVCGVATDSEIMAGAPQFAELAAAMGRLTLDDFKKKLQAERKGLSGARNEMPARLDECKKTADELARLDFKSIRDHRNETAFRLEQLQSELVKLGHGALLDSKRNELTSVKNQLAALINENSSHRQSQMVPVEDKRPSMRAALDKAKRELLRWSQLAANEKALMEDLLGKIQDCRQRWAVEDARVFAGAACPTCGQSLPAEAQEAARTSFEAEVSRRKQDAIDTANREKANLAAAKERREQYINDAVAAENEAARLEAELADYVPEAAPEITDLPGYVQRAAELEEQIRGLEDDVTRLEGESTAIRDEINDKVVGLRRELDELDRELGREAVLDFTQKRMDKLREDARKAGEKLEALDKMLFLCDEFTRYKVRFIEDSINERFGLVRFRLFQEQVNGGLADCCEATVDGVPYSSLNNGARINAGLDVITALSDHYGVRVPLFIDNAESVTRLIGVETQVVRLVVSESDKELRCEYGT